MCCMIYTGIHPDYGEFWRKVIGLRTLDADHLVRRHHFLGRLLLSSGF